MIKAFIKKHIVELIISAFTLAMILPTVLELVPVWLFCALVCLNTCVWAIE